MLLSLAGIPLTAGFVGKFYVLAAGVTAALWPLVVILVINSAIGLFYYLRIVVAMYTPTEEIKPVPAAIAAHALSVTGGVVLTALLVLLVWLGVYPASVIRFIQVAVVSLG
jgi:NADH-quinone oxidoreductase subunit N